MPSHLYRIIFLFIACFSVLLPRSSYAGDPLSLPSTQSVSSSLSCGVDSLSIPPTTQAISANGSNAEVALNFNSQLGGVGVGFYLVNPQVPSSPVNILEARSAAGAGWQFSSFSFTYDGKVILTNQSAGNAVGGQHGYDAELALFANGSINSVSSTQWTPAFSDTYTVDSTGMSTGTTPCSGGPSPYIFDNGALNVAAWPVASTQGSVVAIEHRYSLNSLFNQYWSSWYAMKALYLNKQVADWGNLRVYAGSQASGWFAGPLYPWRADYSSQTLIGSDGFDHQGNECRCPILRYLKMKLSKFVEIPIKSHNGGLQ